MSTSISVGDWVRNELKRCEAAEVRYNMHVVTDEERRILNEHAAADGLVAHWRKEGGSDVVRYVKAPAPPQNVKLSGGPVFADNVFVSSIQIPKDIAILGPDQHWEHYTGNDGELYVHGMRSTAVQSGFAKMTPIRRGNRVIRLEPFQEGDS